MEKMMSEHRDDAESIKCPFYEVERKAIQTSVTSVSKTLEYYMDRISSLVQNGNANGRKGNGR